MNSDKPSVEVYQEMIKELKNVFNKSLVTFDHHYDFGITFNFINGYKVYISSSRTTGDKKISFNKNMTIIHDPFFLNLSHFVFKEKINLEHDNGTYFLERLFNTFSNEGFYDIDKQRENYFKLSDFNLKKLLSDFLNLGYNPKNEFFLYGNDQIQSRYDTKNEKTPFILKENGQTVIIQDKSAYIFTNDNGERYVDMYNSFKYHENGKMYLRENIMTLKNMTIEEYRALDKTETKNVLVSYNPNNQNKVYSKNVLKNDVDLNKEKYLLYEEVNGKKFQLKHKINKKNKIKFYLEDEKGILEIYHPDLLICLIG